MRLFIIAALTLLLITACGPRWYYHHLDWMIPWYVDDYLALDSGQRNDLERRLAIQLNWHCRTQLTEYATFLKSVSRDFQTPDTTVTREQFVSYLQSLNQYWKDLMAQVGPDVADIVITASDDQIGELRRRRVEDLELEVFLGLEVGEEPALRHLGRVGQLTDGQALDADSARDVQCLSKNPFFGLFSLAHALKIVRPFVFVKTFHQSARCSILDTRFSIRPPTPMISNFGFRISTHHLP